MIVVIINGAGTSGKDTFVEMVQKFWEIEESDWVKNLSTIDMVKTAAEILDCPQDNKTDKARNFWSAIKDAWIEYNDGPSKHILEFISLYKEVGDPDDNYLVFIHCREIPEIQKLIAGVKNLGEDVRTLLIDRPSIKSPECEKDNLANIKSFQYDDVIINESLEELEDAAENYVEMLKRK